ncbi:hypothetical protein PINS_up001484 [Pythium insidiosum]|nr:hypothetical protein PINS_up001484 [Pythium insidiosum]
MAEVAQYCSVVLRLSMFQSLTAEDNRIKSVDPSIALLPQLQLLRIRKNQLTASAIEEFLGSISGAPVPCPGLKELDLRNNLLTDLPNSIAKLPKLETLLLAFNKVETLDGFPWHKLQRTSVISLSDNRLRSLGQVYLAPMLASLAFENNNLVSVPCELGLCPHLRAIYMNGNPQKTVRGAVIAKGSAEILMYLKNKLPLGSQLPEPEDKRSVSALTASEAAVKTSRVSSSLADTYAAGGGNNSTKSTVKVGESERLVSVAPRSGIAPRNNESTSSKCSTPRDNVEPTKAKNTEGSVSTIETIEKSIAILEDQLERRSLSVAKQYALKKELAVLRSSKIRIQREMKSQE